MNVNDTAFHRRTKGRLLRCSQVPSPNPRIDPNAANQVRFETVPIYVRYCTIMWLKYVFDRGFPYEQEIPDQTLSRDVSVLVNNNNGINTHSRSLDVETMYSAWEGWGFHWTSATSQVPPCGRKRGTSRGECRSIMNKPFRLLTCQYRKWRYYE